MKRAEVTCLMLAFFAGSVFSQTINICGTVKDQNGQPLTNTVIRLSTTTYDNGYWATAPYMAHTDQNGHYQIGTGVCPSTSLPDNSLPKGEVYTRPTYSCGKVLFNAPVNGSLVKMSLYDLSGRFVREVMNKNLSLGSYSVSIDARDIAAQFYILRVAINGAASVMKLQPVSHGSAGTVVQNASGFQTRLAKLAAVVDTLRATEPGYTIGVTPIEALEGLHDFTLTKNNTWNGDFDSFWGDTNTYPKAGSTPVYIILNRTNGAWPDSKISWSHEGSGAKIPLSQQKTKPIESERMYVYIAPGDSNNRYFDFLEVNYGGGVWNGNSTRVDGWRLPITFRIKTTAGIDTVMGDEYWMFYQSRQSKFDEWANEVPKEFTHLGKGNFAHIWAPHMTAANYFNTGGVYADYFKRYQDSVVANYVIDPATWPAGNFPGGDPGPYPTVPKAWDIFACTGPNPSIGASPYWSAAFNRHVAHLEPHGKQWYNWGYKDTAYFYMEAPANFFSRWCHRRSINNYCYGFPYDDNGDHQAFMTMRNIQWIAVAVGW